MALIVTCINDRDFINKYVTQVRYFFVLVDSFQRAFVVRLLFNFLFVHFDRSPIVKAYIILAAFVHTRFQITVPLTTCDAEDTRI